MDQANDIRMNPLSLGMKRGEFRASSWGQMGRGCLGFICMAIGVASLVAIVVGVVSGRLMGAGKVLVFGGLFLIGGVALFRSLRSANQTCVEVFADGLVLHHGLDAMSCRWDDILMVIEKEAVNGDEVIQESLNSEARAFHLHLRSGQVIVLKSYLRGLAKLGTVIKRETLSHLLLGYQADLQEGRPAQFGAITLHREGIEVQGQMLLWAEFRCVQRKGGWLKLYSRGAWLMWKKVKLPEVPDFHVLLELVDQHSIA